MTSLLGWLDEPSSETGMSFHAHGGWQYSSYQQIAHAALGVAGFLASVGVGPEDIVTLVLPTGPAYAVVLFGVLAGGATPNPVPPPALFTESAGYASHAAGLLRIVRPRAVITDSLSANVIMLARQEMGGDFPVFTTTDIEDAAPSPTRRRPPGTALLQFSSGSSGIPKAVRVSMDNLEANVAAIVQWLDMQPGDLTATWLPAHHDMGLIGCLLTPAATGTGVLGMSPLSFVRAPLLWLDCFGRLGATLTATPAFGLARTLQHLERSPTENRDWDLSRWRAAIVGAERVSAALLHRFARALRPWGFRSEVLCPAYGLVESTLAVTGVQPGEPVRCLELPQACEPPARVPALLDDVADGGATVVTGCGRPLANAELRIVDVNGTPVRDGEIGEILVRGPCIGTAYRVLDNRDQRIADHLGWLHTGDAGMLHANELFVVGRMGDALKVRGKTLFAEDIEEQMAACAQVARHRIAALLGASGAGDAALILVEHADMIAGADIVAMLRRYVGPDVQIRLFRGPAGCIARTSSGKPRRRLMWRQLTARELPDGVIECQTATTQMQAGRGT